VTRSGTGADAELFFEDIPVGHVFDLGTIEVHRAEMLAFARRFDPQWYHVDEDLAKASPFGDLIASGFFTAALFMRAYADAVLSRAAANASPGLEDLRWLAPVYGGDRLTGKLEVLGADVSKARAGYGTLHLCATLTRRNGDGRDVMRTTFRGWFAQRPRPSTDPGAS
jgi:acyl dehydratase